MLISVAEVFSRLEGLGEYLKALDAWILCQYSSLAHIFALPDSFYKPQVMLADSLLPFGCQVDLHGLLHHPMEHSDQLFA